MAPPSETQPAFFMNASAIEDELGGLNPLSLARPPNQLAPDASHFYTY